MEEIIVPIGTVLIKQDDVGDSVSCSFLCFFFFFLVVIILFSFM